VVTGSYGVAKSPKDKMAKPFPTAEKSLIFEKTKDVNHGEKKLSLFPQEQLLRMHIIVCLTSLHKMLC